MEKGKKKDINTRFSTFLKKKNIKQQDVSKKIGLDQQSISRFKNGQREIKKFHALALQDTYGVSAEWLLTGKGEMMLERTKTSKPPPATPSPPPENTDKSDQILRAVESGRDDLRDDLRRVGDDVRRVGDDVRDLRAGLRNTDTRLVSVEERVTALEKLDFGLTETGLSPKRMEMAKKRQSS